MARVDRLLAPRRALLVALALVAGGTGCTCGGERRGDEPSPAATREPWLQACVASPAAAWADLVALGGEALAAHRLPAGVVELASRATGLSDEALAASVDWDRPLAVVVLEPASGERLAEAMALVATRASEDRSRGSGRRELRGRDGPVHVLVDPESVALGRTAGALGDALAHAREACGREAGAGPDVTLEVAPAPLGSARLRRWVEGFGGRLEGSARQATARHGRSSLGDPEALARTIARAMERERGRAERSAPLRATLRLEADRLDLEVSSGASGGDARVAAGSSPRDGLALMPPDSYLVLATHATGAERAGRARRLVEGLGRVAGERLEGDRRERMAGLAERLAGATDGWATLALRPALEPGPAVLVAAVGCREPEVAAEALVEAAGLLGEGYLAELLDHLGVALSVVAVESGAGRGEVRFAVRAPDWVTDGRGAGPRRLLGEAPVLAWRVAGSSTLLVAFGPDPARELARLDEARSSASASVLGQPVVSSMVERGEDPSLLLYAWAPAVAAMLTGGAPGAGAAPRGGLALALDAPEGRGRLRLGMDSAQMRSLLSTFSPRGAR